MTMCRGLSGTPSTWRGAAVELGSHLGLLMRSRQAVRERFQPFDGEPVPNHEVNDPLVELNAAAEIMLQRFRDAHAARVEREQALNEGATDA